MARTRTVLAGDIGGSNCRLALFEEQGKDFTAVARATLPSRDAESLEPLIERFLKGQSLERPVAAALAVAGPVVDGECRTTNLPWHLTERGLSQSLGGVPVRLLNDMVAWAHGVPFLTPSEAPRIDAQGVSLPGNRGVVAAGTGLGEAFLIWDGKRHLASPSEGQHGTFGPRNEEEIELSRFVMARHGHPTFEHVVSGPALPLLVDFLVETGRMQPTAADGEALRGESRPEAITARALDGTSALCLRAVRLFLSLYGAEAGNVALRGACIGGIWLGGGIAPRLLPLLREGDFREAFCAKGRFRSFCEAIPIHVVLQPDAALHGAAALARSLSAEARP